MKNRKIYWVSEGNYDYLSFSANYYYPPKYASIENTTLEQLTEFLDIDAEGSNCHAFVMVHRALAGILHKALGREKAADIMWQIAEIGGLHNIGEKEVIESLSLPSGWKDWKLPD